MAALLALRYPGHVQTTAMASEELSLLAEPLDPVLMEAHTASDVGPRVAISCALWDIALRCRLVAQPLLPPPDLHGVAVRMESLGPQMKGAQGGREGGSERADGGVGLQALEVAKVAGFELWEELLQERWLILERSGLVARRIVASLVVGRGWDCCFIGCGNWLGLLLHELAT